MTPLNRFLDASGVSDEMGVSRPSDRRLSEEEPQGTRISNNIHGLAVEADLPPIAPGRESTNTASGSGPEGVGLMYDCSRSGFQNGNPGSYASFSPIRN